MRRPGRSSGRLGTARYGRVSRVLVTRLALALLVTGALGLVPATASAQSRHGRPGRAQGCLRVLTLMPGKAHPTVRATAWTPRLMDSAKPFSEAALARRARRQRKTTGRHAPVLPVAAPARSCASLPSAQTPSGSFSGAAARSALPDSHEFDGYPTVGKLFFESILGARSCSAEVINSPKPPKAGSMLILTAAHCVVGVVGGIPYGDDDFVFAPKWANGKSPYGRWSIVLHNIYINNKWMDCTVPVVHCSTNPEWDYAIMIVNRLHKHNIGFVTGANGAAWNVSYFLKGVRIIGYPDGSPKPLTSTTTTSLTIADNEDFLTGNARGEGEGSSGGPWFGSLDLHPGKDYGVGILIGDTGGYQGGGPSSGVPSYSPHWTAAFGDLVTDVQKHE
jgi:hypothetical protein